MCRRLCFLRNGVKQYVTVYDECSALITNQMWSSVPLPPNRYAVGSKWIFEPKKEPRWLVLLIQSPVGATGFHLLVGLDFVETFSLVVKLATIHVVLIVVLAKG